MKQRKKSKNKGGQPSKMTPATITVLEEYFAYGLSDEKACFMAGISVMSLHRYIEKHPEYRDRKEALKQSTDIKAQLVIAKSVETNVGTAQWWLGKRVSEFKEVVKIEANVNVEHSLSLPMQAAALAYSNARRAEIISKIKELPSA